MYLFPRWTQKAELIRISQSLLLSNVPIHWIIVEDTKNKENEHEKAQVLINFEKRLNDEESNLRVTLLTAATAEKFRLKPNHPNWIFPRGVAQRNAGIEYIINEHNFQDIPNHQYNKSAIVYFADDDNTYDHKLFPELTQFTKPVAVLPVGIVGGQAWEGPICSNGKPTHFNAKWEPQRPYPLDMAGFAVQLSALKESKSTFSDFTKRGWLESDFLLKLLKIPLRYEDWTKENHVERRSQLTLERTNALADDCTTILVWHTRTEKPKGMPDPSKDNGIYGIEI